MSFVLAFAALSGCAAHRPPTSIATFDERNGRDREQWDSLSNLKQGTALRIVLRDGKSTAGRFLEWTSTDVGIVRGDGIHRLQRHSVQRVSILRSTRGRSALRGLLIGAAAGAAQGAHSTESNQMPWSLALAASWGAIGAGIGALAGGEQSTVIYQASPK